MNLRTYCENTLQHKLYTEMHENQTLEYVLNAVDKYKEPKNCKMTMKKALSYLDEFIDPSDPDISEPNSIHAYQTAERIRKLYPENHEFQLCGLIHDVGKILYKFNEPNWSVVGDTFVVGCEFPNTIVYYESLKNNPDYGKYSNLGIYEKKCGIENLTLSFGHDEYLYMVLQYNKNHKLSNRYMKMIRYHSFYPWHTSRSYTFFENGIEDKLLLNDVRLLNSFDLYSKEDTDFKLTEEIVNYYDDLLDKHFPNELDW